MEIEPMRWQNPVSRAAAAAIHTYLRATAAAIHTYLRAAAAAIHTYLRAAAATTAAAAAATTAALKFHPKHVTNKNKTKHIMKISHIK